MKAQTALCIVPTGFGILSGYITRYSKEVFLSDIILNSSFYDMAVNFDYLYQFAVRMSLFIAFNLIFGVYIYKNFCTACKCVLKKFQQNMVVFETMHADCAVWHRIYAAKSDRNNSYNNDNACNNKNRCRGIAIVNTVLFSIHIMAIYYNCSD